MREGGRVDTRRFGSLVCPGLSAAGPPEVLQRQCRATALSLATGVMRYVGWSHNHRFREVTNMREPNGMPRMPLRPATAVLLVTLSGFACASHRILVAPRLNLVPYGSVGLVTFTMENAKGSLHEFATRRFEEDLLAAQTAIEVQDFAQADSAHALARTGQRAVPVDFLGHVT